MTEFSRTFRIDTLGPQPRKVEIEAGADERAALARRFGVPAVHRLSAEAALSRAGETVRAEGTLRAAAAQSCVATGVPVETEIAERFRIEFRPQPEEVAPDEEVELGESEMDVIFYDGAMIDLGEAVAESLSLALDPYPRAPDAEEALRGAGVRSEAEAKAESSPFAALKGKFGG